MQVQARAVKAVSAVLVCAMISGCTLPRSGPTAREITAEDEDSARFGLHIVDVTPDVAAATRYSEELGFGPEFTSMGLLGADTIRAGDTLSISVWENVDAGLLAGEGQKMTGIEQIQVDQSGDIFMPYVGRIGASGKTPSELREQITESLAAQTPDPQVEVTRIAGDGATVSVLGAVGTPGVYPIEAPTRRLSAMLAMAGGVGIEPEIAQITLERNGRIGRIWLQDLYDNPGYDVALRNGDSVIVEPDRRTFTALGATQGQSRVNFTERDMSAIEAIATAGGLDGDAADPTGIFVFRTEKEDVARRVLGGDPVAGPQRMAYVMNLTEPEGMFAAREFVIRDEDTVYITEAPYKSWREIIGLTGTGVALAGSVAAISR